MPDDLNSNDTEKEAKLDNPKSPKTPKIRKTSSKVKKPKVELVQVIRESSVHGDISYALPTSGSSDITLETKPEKLTLAQEKSIVIESKLQTTEGQKQQAILTAQDILTKSEKELRELDISKREANNVAKNLRIITAILLGKKRNKDLAQVLQTDKSFTSKQVKELEDRGLVKREGEGKDVSYEVDTWNVLKFLQSKVVIKWKKEQDDKSDEKGGEIK